MQKEKQWKMFPREPFKDFQPQVLDSRTRSTRKVSSETLRLKTVAHQTGVPSTSEPQAEQEDGTDSGQRSHENAYATSIDKIEIPCSYEVAINDPIYSPEWKYAILTELTTLQSLRTWEYMALPTGKRLLGHKWVFAVKYTPTGQLDKFKARLTARELSQTYGDDFLETFLPTMRAESLRVLLAIAAHKHLHIRQIDVISAYQRSKLHADVYMKPPKGLECPPGKVLKLETSLYGLKQSRWEWYIEACHGLESIGLRPTTTEPSVFTLEDRSLLLGLYVDDMIILSADEKSVKRVVNAIKKLWDIKDMGEVSKILGLHIHGDRKRHALTISQTSYIKETLAKFNLMNAKPAGLPVTDRNTLIAASPNKQYADQLPSQQAIGRLMWISKSTRFDIAYAVGQLSQYCNKPAIRHWNGVIQVLKYLSGTRKLKLQIGGDSPDETSKSNNANYGYKLHGFSDADYAGDQTDRKSVTGHMYLLNKGPVSWSSTLGARALDNHFNI